MAGRPLPAIALAVGLSTVACSADPTPTVDAGAAIDDSGTDTPTPAAVELTELARRAAGELAEDPTSGDSGVLASEPETWWVTFEVDIALDHGKIDDPLAALPAPFDGLAPSLARMTVSAESPSGPIRSRLEPPFAGLREELDGSRQVVTTIPGDDPPSTATWPIVNPRIVQLSLGVVDFDAAQTGPEVIALVGADALRLGPPEGFVVITVAEARSGVRATLPPLTGTVPIPPDTDGITTGTPTTARPESPGS